MPNKSYRQSLALTFCFCILYPSLFPFFIASTCKIIHLTIGRIPNYFTENTNNRGRNKKRWHNSIFFHIFTLFGTFPPPQIWYNCMSKKMYSWWFQALQEHQKNPHVNLWQFILHPYGKVHLAWTFSRRWWGCYWFSTLLEYKPTKHITGEKLIMVIRIKHA